MLVKFIFAALACSLFLFAIYGGYSVARKTVPQEEVRPDPTAAVPLSLGSEGIRTAHAPHDREESVTECLEPVPALVTGGSSEDWDKIYAAAPYEELLTEYTALKAYYLEVATPELRKRFDSGDYDVVGTDSKYFPTESDNREVSSVQLLPRSEGGEVRKAILRKDEFPELYDIKEKLGKIEVRLRELKGEARAAAVAEKERK